MKFVYLLLGVSFLLAGCNSGNKSKTSIQASTPKAEFQPVEIPTLYDNTPESAADYLMGHYWDNFDFSDTTLIYKPNITEQGFVDFINILLNVPPDVASKGILNSLKSAEDNIKMFRHFIGLYEKYLYDPNSPMRNEELYIPVLDYMIHSKLLGETDKIRPRHRFELAQKNRRGHHATDFSYTQENGKTCRLSQIKNKYTLIFFNNPDCQGCFEIREALKNSVRINEMRRNGELCILSVYPDEDLTIWREHAAEYPREWIYSYDKNHEINDKELYDLRAIPTIYLIDRDMNVILKDAFVEEVEYFCRRMFNKEIFS